MNIGIFDDMNRKVILPQPLTRVVSLVPSDTETLFALGVGDRIVGRTRYCVEPGDEVQNIPIVGGTKDIDVDAIVALQPDLVIANQEENARSNLEELAARGIRVFIAFPKRFNDAIAHVARLARCFGAGETAKDLLREGYGISTEQVANSMPVSVFVPIWNAPWMTFSDHTYSNDILKLSGARNVFADRQREYPLKADLGLTSPLSADQVALRDRRYPRITEAEIIERAPELILLPDEPFAFSDKDRDYFASLDIPAAHNQNIHFYDGKDLFWPGVRSAGAILRLRTWICRHK